MSTEQRAAMVDMLGLSGDHVQTFGAADTSGELDGPTTIVYVNPGLAVTTALTTVARHFCGKVVYVSNQGDGAYTLNGVAPTHNPAIFHVFGQGAIELAQTVGT